MSEWIEPGQAAPEFSLMDDRGQPVSLAQFRGKSVVLYFYPKDDTPGCTKEACSFRDHQAQFLAGEAVVLGVSPDSVESHVHFRDKFQLNFPLLADLGHQVCELYGAWREKNMYGKKSWGVQRSTYLIDPQGRVVKVWKKVSVDGHEAQVLEALSSLALTSG